MDILKHDAQLFSTVMSTLQYMEMRLAARNPTDTPPEDQALDFNSSINILSDQCKSLKLSGAIKIIKYIKQHFSQSDCGRLSENIHLLHDVIQREIGERILLIIPEERIAWLNNKDSLGVKVSTAFTKAIPDIMEAGNCYAVGLYTACVFHLMRIAEYGLRALAKERGVTLKHKPLEWAEWGPMIREIEKIVDPIETKAHAGPEKDAALDFYRGALGEFRAFKDVYRNPVMHPRKMYDKHEAGSAMQHVSGFMKKLSTHITEKTRKPINWKLKYTP